MLSQLARRRAYVSTPWRLKQLAAQKISSFSSTSFCSTSNQTQSPMADTETELIYQSRNAVRLLTLNRPRKLNALSSGILESVYEKLNEFVKSDLANIVIVKGKEPRAFSAGADVASLAKAAQSEGLEKSLPGNAKFFQTEFVLNHTIATYPKPYVSILQGVTMGGGVGLSCHGAFRVATENTLLAMPETKIGYYPDVGALFFLSKLNGELGLYAALTGHRFKGYDSFKFGISTHYIGEDSLLDLERRLEELELGSIDSSTSAEYFKLVDWCLEEFSSEPPADYKPSLSVQDLDTIDECFKYDSLEEIINALQNAEAKNPEFVKNALSILSPENPEDGMSPLSLKVTLKAYRQAAKLDLQAALQQDMRLSYNFCNSPEFREGVIALLVEKRKPNWTFKSLSDVSNDTVNSMFAPIPEEFTLKFPSEANFTEYPYNFGLPREKDIMDFVTGETSEQDTKATKQDVIEFFKKKYPDGLKQGLTENVNEVLSRKTSPDPTDASLLDWNY